MKQTSLFSSLKETIHFLMEQILKEEVGLNSLISQLKKIEKNNPNLYERKQEYAKFIKESKLEIAGIGSIRISYKISENYILKLMRGEYPDEYYNHQNKAEYNFYHNCAKQHKQFFAQTLEEHDEDFMWIIAEKANLFENEDEISDILFQKFGFTNEEFKKLADQVMQGDYIEEEYRSWTNFISFIFEYSASNISAMKKDDYKKAVSPYAKDAYKYLYLGKQIYDRSEWFREFITALSDCKISAEDLHSENWGYRPSTGELIVIDYGIEMK